MTRECLSRPSAWIRQHFIEKICWLKFFILKVIFIQVTIDLAYVTGTVPAKEFAIMSTCCVFIVVIGE